MEHNHHHEQGSLVGHGDLDILQCVVYSIPIVTIKNIMKVIFKLFGMR